MIFAVMLPLFETDDKFITSAAYVGRKDLGIYINMTLMRFDKTSIIWPLVICNLFSLHLNAI